MADGPEDWLRIVRELEAVELRQAEGMTADDRAHGWDQWKWDAAAEMVRDWRLRIMSSRQLLESHYGWVTRALFDLDVDTEYGVAQRMVEVSVEIGSIMKSQP